MRERVVRGVHAPPVSESLGPDCPVAVTLSVPAEREELAVRVRASLVEHGLAVLGDGGADAALRERGL